LRKVEELLKKRPQKRLDSGPVQLGSQWSVRFGPLGIGLFKTTSRISKYERPRSFTRTTSGSFVSDAEYLFEPIPTGTRVTLTLNVSRLPSIVSAADYYTVQALFMEQSRDALEKGATTGRSNVTDLDFNSPVETVFAILADPLSWQLCGLSVIDDLTQRPISIGTTWKYETRLYTCIGLTPPFVISLETNKTVIEYTLKATPTNSTRCFLRLTTTSREPAPVHSTVWQRHKELFAAQRKLLETAPSSAYLNRISMTSHTTTGISRAPSVVHVTTEALINREPREVFRLVVGNPDEFWRWMVDRSDPGGLCVTPDWPNVGSSYRYKKRRTTSILSLFYPWDSGTVRVLSMEPNSAAVLEETQDDAKTIITTTVRLNQPEGSQSGTEAVLMRRGYTASVHKWLPRKLIGGHLLPHVIKLAVGETANIVAVCESDLRNGERTS